MRIPAAIVLLLAAPAFATDIIIEGFAYSPSDLTIPAGTTIRWTNLDSIEHTVTSQTGPGTLIPSGIFDSGFLSLNQSYQFTFAQPGTFHYFCTPHGSSMQGVIRVVAACYPNCDSSSTPPTLNANDFNCFLNAFASGDSYANCDASSLPPTLNANDFLCFLNAFAAGCS